jgi:hypothetical protein
MIEICSANLLRVSNAHISLLTFQKLRTKIIRTSNYLLERGAASWEAVLAPPGRSPEFPMMEIEEEAEAKELAGQ